MCYNIIFSAANRKQQISIGMTMLETLSHIYISWILYKPWKDGHGAVAGDLVLERFSWVIVKWEKQRAQKCVLL